MWYNTFMPKNNQKSTNKSDKDEKKVTKTEATSSERSTAEKQATVPVPRKYIILGAVIIALLGLAGYMFSKWMVVAKVNGDVVTRTEYTKELEKTAGKQVLEGLTTKRIIEQEAKKKNITVTDAEINAEFKKIEEQLKTQGQSLDQILAFQGMTRDGLKEQIVVQKTVEKLVGNVTVATEEVEKYIEENEALAGEDTDLEALRTRANDELKQQKTDAKIQELIANLRKNAKVEYFTE